jgi:hypothetical protein
MEGYNMTKKRRQQLDAIKKRWENKPCDPVKYTQLLHFKNAMIRDPGLKFVNVEQACAYVPPKLGRIARVRAWLSVLNVFRD